MYPPPRGVKSKAANREAHEQDATNARGRDKDVIQVATVQVKAALTENCCRDRDVSQLQAAVIHAQALARQLCNVSKGGRDICLGKQ